MEEVLELFNSTQILNDKKEMIKQAFLEYYGNDYEDIINERFNKVTILGYLYVKDYKEILSKYSGQMDENLKNKIQNLYDKVTDATKKIYEEGDKEFFRTFKYLIPKDELQKIELIGDFAILSKFASKNLNSIKVKSLIEYFDENIELNEEVKNKRIEYFNSLRIDLGDKYDDYMNNEQCIKLIPTKDIIDKVKSKRLELLKKCNEESWNLNEDYIKNINNILSNVPEVEKDRMLDVYNDSVRKNKVGYCTSFLNKGELLQYLFINAGEIDTLDNTILHEFNHCLEMNLLNTSEEGFDFSCGWDIINVKYTENEDVENIDKLRNIRGYERLNEYINEKISLEVLKILENNGNKIFKSSKFKYETQYFFGIELLNPIFEMFKEEIIKSRITGNLQFLFDKLGKENFLLLNDFFSKFDENKFRVGYLNDLEGLDKQSVEYFNEMNDKYNQLYNHIMNNLPIQNNGVKK